ncbi:MAG: phosphoadenosine phosphosulfate reductase family protein [Candidatus Latescibacterota bacterium]|nr:MAG: phosphoadenosine phosphosulfate reductase family protein [Candidatus Latescibacterota bacterium]
MGRDDWRDAALLFLIPLLAVLLVSSLIVSFKPRRELDGHDWWRWHARPRSLPKVGEWLRSTVLPFSESPELVQRFNGSVAAIAKALKAPGGTMVAFDGRKGGVVLMNLLQFALRAPKRRVQADPVVFWVRLRHDFGEVSDFVERAERHYGVRVRAIEAESFREGVGEARRLCPNCSALLVGSRRQKVTCRQRSPIERVEGFDLALHAPLLDWTYGNVWAYIAALGLDYPKVYDVGYTSVGTKRDSAPNPFLRRFVDGEKTYEPAHRLRDASKERSGRAIRIA